MEGALVESWSSDVLVPYLNSNGNEAFNVLDNIFASELEFLGYDLDEGSWLLHQLHLGFHVGTVLQ